MTTGEQDEKDVSKMQFEVTYRTLSQHSLCNYKINMKAECQIYGQKIKIGNIQHQYTDKVVVIINHRNLNDTL